MMNRMIAANLIHRPIRSLISIIAIALEVTLILLIVGLSLGELNHSRTSTSGIGADVLVMPPSSQNIIGFTSAPMSIKIGDILAKLPHVTLMTPVITQISSSESLEIIAGIDYASYSRMSGMKCLRGTPFQSPDDALIDDLYARVHHLKVGDSIEILSHQFRISGIVEAGKGGRKFLELSKLQDLTAAQDKASTFYLKLDDPANVDTVIDEIKNVHGLGNYKVMSMEAWLANITPSHYPGLSDFLDVVIGISVLIGFIAIFQAMYTAVMERTREIGILKSMGASKLYIINVILRETVVLAIGGIIVGVLFSLSVKAVLDDRTTLPVIVNMAWVLYATLIAIVGAVLGALYPAFKAARKDPVDALAYE
jgi:putative ABC transport system permease protein